MKNKKKQPVEESKPAAPAEESTSTIWTDDRFAHLVKDPRFKLVPFSLNLWPQFIWLFLYFRGIPRKERKVRIDKRFQSMFEDPKFKVKYTYDKYGRKINKSSTEDLKRFYELKEDDSDEEEDEKKAEDVVGAVKPEEESSDDDASSNDELEVNEKLAKKVKKRLKDLDIDYARGEGKLLTDSSSDDESSSDEEEVGPGLIIDHVWGELDRDAPLTEESSKRLAVCNMDWDKIRAEDIMVLCNSFLPPNGTILKVSIYPSEFGKERMAEEEKTGPQELVGSKSGEKDAKNDDSDIDDLLESSDDESGSRKKNRKQTEEDQEGDDYHMEKLRQYQLNRLKYYYAVIECDSVSTADKLYAECDGLEYESSAAKFDLRFIPDDMSFDDEEATEKCTELPDLGRYQPRQFQTTALQNAKVELTWDETNEDRKEFAEKMMEGKLNEVSDMDLRKYVAYSSDEDEKPSSSKIKLNPGTVSDDEGGESDAEAGQSSIDKYRNLLNEIKENEEKKKTRNVEMEFSWNVGAQEKLDTEKAPVAPQSSTALTPFEQLIEKRNQKKKAKQEKFKKKNQKDLESDEALASEDDIPDGIDMNDPYFAEEFAGGDFVGEKPKSKKKADKEKREEQDEQDRREQAELTLLLEDDGDNKKSHFSLKKIQSAETANEATTKRKRKKLLKKSKKEVLEAKQGQAQDDFEIDLADDRFSAVYSSHLYNIDPTNPGFKKTKGMEKIITEKLKRKRYDDDEQEVDDLAFKKDKKSLDKVTTNMLVKNIKRKINKT